MSGVVKPAGPREHRSGIRCSTGDLPGTFRWASRPRRCPARSARFRVPVRSPATHRVGQAGFAPSGGVARLGFPESTQIDFVSPFGGFPYTPKRAVRARGQALEGESLEFCYVEQAFPGCHVRAVRDGAHLAPATIASASAVTSCAEIRMPGSPSGE